MGKSLYDLIFTCCFSKELFKGIRSPALKELLIPLDFKYHLLESYLLGGLGMKEVFWAEP